MNRALKHLDLPVQRNASQWKAISYFLAGIEVMARGDAAAGKRSDADAAPRAAINFGGCAAPGTSIVPVGNTGTTSPRGEA
ncbi:hypothetical protein D3C71_1215310 [compost metagenome]